MRVPLASIFEDHWINLQNDRYADPHGDNEEYAQPLRVFDAYGGRPRAKDELAVWTVKFCEADRDSINGGVTLIVSPGDGARATLIHFPDDQHVIEVLDDPHDGSDEEFFDT